MIRHGIWLVALTLGCTTDGSNDEKNIAESEETDLLDTADTDTAHSMAYMAHALTVAACHDRLV